MDAGPIAAQYECDLAGDEKAPEFLTEMFAVGTTSRDRIDLSRSCNFYI